MDKKYGWVDYVNLGAQLQQAKSQTEIAKQLSEQTAMISKQTEIMQQQQLEIQRITEGRHALIQYQKMIRKIESIYPDYPQYATYVSHQISNQFSAVGYSQGFFVEMNDIKMADEIQSNIGHLAQSMLNDLTPNQAEELKNMESGINFLESARLALEAAPRFEQMSQLGPTQNRNALVEKCKIDKKKSLAFGVIFCLSLILFLSFSGSALLNKDNRTIYEGTDCPVASGGLGQWSGGYYCDGFLHNSGAWAYGGDLNFVCGPSDPDPVTMISHPNPRTVAVDKVNDGNDDCSDGSDEGVKTITHNILYYLILLALLILFALTISFFGLSILPQEVKDEFIQMETDSIIIEETLLKHSFSSIQDLFDTANQWGNYLNRFIPKDSASTIEWQSK